MLMKFKQLGIVKGILSIVIVIGILVGAGYGLYYQYVYKQSPEYSLRVIYKAIQDGDTDTFFAMVDGEGILHRAYDPYIQKLSKELKERNISQANSKDHKNKLNLGEALLIQAKDSYYLDVKEVLLDQDLKKNLRTRPKDPFEDNLRTLKEPGRYTLISIEQRSNENGVANIEIRALDNKIKETKVFPVEMTQMDNKLWRITGYDYKKYDLPYDGYDRY